MAAYTDARALDAYGVYAGFVAAPMAVANLLIDTADAAIRGVRHVATVGANAFNRWHVRRNTMRELAALSDRQLLDIGLVRGDLEKVVDSLC